MSKLSYEYEIDTSTILIDSNSLPETSEERKFTNMYFYSTNQVHCPIYDCDIITNLEVNFDGEVEYIMANSKPSQI